MNLSQIAGMAKVIFPKWADRIDQAQQLAQQFSPSKDGLTQLMNKYGKNRSDLVNAVKNLDNPLIKNTLGRFPELDSTIRNAANELIGSENQNQSSYSQPLNNSNSVSGGASLHDMQARLERLKKMKYR